MALLSQFSLVEIITFLVLGGAALKGFVTFMEWAVEKITGAVHHVDSRQELQEKVQTIQDKMDSFERDVSLLKRSDLCIFKSYIAKEYNNFLKQGSIDIYSLEAIEERYKIYKEEGGNSFVPQLIEALRELPKEPQKAEE